MVAAKVFEFREHLDLPSIAEKIKAFREEETREVGGKPVPLATEILNVKLTGEEVFGILSRDYVLVKVYHGKPIEVPVTEEVPFWIRPFRGRTFLVAVAPSKPRGVRKVLTNYVANKLSSILFGHIGAIVEAGIAPETLQGLHESSPEATKLIWFDSVDIPNVEKLALAGSALADTELYKRYLEHGNVWYVVFGLRKRGIVVGVTRNCVVTCFSRIGLRDFMDAISEEIFPLIS
ncbi:TPA: hypothetical protein EYP44_02095 [Candidatus Bathyarchaeota archaeon]|nr:hypothetical protein [Candidatus Bathyarchaeota archaeon]